MTHLTPVEAAQLHLALKLTFTKNYDFQKYGTNIKSVNETSFAKRNDRYQFVKLAKKYDAQQLGTYMLANTLENPSGWIGSYTHDIYLAYCKISESLEYTFRTDVGKIRACAEKKGYTSLDQLWTGEDPDLVRMYLQKDITRETLMILDILLQSCLIEAFRSTDTVLWPKQRVFLIKYRMFMPKIDTTKYTTILKEGLDNLALV